MTDLLFQVGLSNACFAFALAIIALLASVITKRAHIIHLLWLLVLVKLVTPPMMTVTVATISTPPNAAESKLTSEPSIMLASVDEALYSGHATGDGSIFGAYLSEKSTGVQEESDPYPQLVSASRNPEVSKSSVSAILSQFGLTMFNYGKRWFLPVWLLGSVIIFCWSLFRVRRFGQLINEYSEDAPQNVQDAAFRIARRLKLKSMPIICTTTARISPMVWWTGGKVRIVIPQSLIDEMDAKDWHWVLAHEMAHVRRRDYLVRWIEWLACVLFWWNPVVWWAMRNLRAAEEICCDDLVLSRLDPKPQSYAISILTAVESLARPAIRPPAMASEINSDGYLERRFRMIVSNKTNRNISRWLKACILICAVVVLPLGVALAQDKGDDQTKSTIEQRLESIGNRLRGAVERDDMTEEDAWTKWAEIKEKVIVPRLKAAVKSGEMTEERAWDIWKGIEKGELAEKLKSAVVKGEITAEEARAKWAEITGEGKEESDKDESGEESEADDAEDTIDGDAIKRVGDFLGAIGKKIEAAAKAGDITGEEAAAKWQEAKEKVIKGAVGAGKLTLKEARILWQAVEIKEAVRAGRLSEEGARKMLIGIRLRTAVEQGSITVDEAKVKWAEIFGEETEEEAEEAIKYVPREISKAIAAALLKETPCDFLTVPEAAVALYGGEGEDAKGLLIVPARRYLKEETAPELEVGDKAPFALLYTSSDIVPIIDGKPVDREQMRVVIVTDENGREHKSNCIALFVKRTSEEQYIVYGLAKGGKDPIVIAKIVEAERVSDHPVLIEVKDIDEESETAAVVITTWSKYQASFRAGTVSE